MCLVLGVIGDHEVGIATRRALEDILPLRLIEAADELPGAVSARRPLVIVASHRDRFGDPVVPHLAEVRDVLPQIGIVLISDVGATLSNGIRDLSMLGEIRSVKARSRHYPANLQRAVDEQAERYRAEYLLRAFAPHTPPKLQPLLDLCARKWGKRLRGGEVAKELKCNHHTLTKYVRAAQPECRLHHVLVCHHVSDIAWELCARAQSLKMLAVQFKYRPASRLRANVRRWVGIDLRELGMTGVRGWEGLIDHFVHEFIGRPSPSLPDPQPPQR